MSRSHLPEALSLAERGYPIFPCHTPRSGGCSCGDPECDDIGKHPRTKNGFKDATTDPEQIRLWWGRWPDANIGMPTGQASGLDALDVDLDVPLNGFRPPSGPVSKTGGGGLHRFYRHRNGVKNSQNPGEPHVRGEGGYVILPPSLHRSGERYRWLRSFATPLRPFPQIPSTNGSQAVSGPGTRGKRAFESLFDGKTELHRHQAGLDAASFMRRMGADTNVIDWVLKGLNTTFAPPYKGKKRIDYLRIAPESEHWDVAYEGQVRQEVMKQDAREEAARLRVARHRGPAFALPEVGFSLVDDLAEHDADPTPTIAGLHCEGFSSVLIAVQKTGKTALSMNLVRSLADGVPLLDYFAVQPNGRRILYMNYELLPNQFRKWMNEVGVIDQELVLPLHLRGVAFPFWEPAVRAVFIEWLVANDIGNLIMDPAMRAWRGYVTKSNDNDQVGAFLYGELDSLKREAGVENLWLTHHIGKSGRTEDAEEGAGAHQFGAWPDATWVYTKKAAGQRYLRADGRDIDQDAIAVRFDEDARWPKRLTSFGERRVEVEGDEKELKLMEALSDGPLTAAGWRDESGVDKTRADRVGRRLVLEGLVERRYRDGSLVDEDAVRPGVAILCSLTSVGVAELAARRR
jgi:hypothetical protein